LAAEDDGGAQDVLAPRADGVAQQALEAVAGQVVVVDPLHEVVDHGCLEVDPGELDHRAPIVQTDREADLEEVADALRDDDRARVRLHAAPSLLL
jgi:hypothetical protein